MRNTTHFFQAWLICLPISAFQPVDINIASKEQIALLPLVGEKLASNIVSFRQSNGFINHRSQLLKIPGMNKQKLEALTGRVIFSKQKRSAALDEAIQITLEKKPLIPLAELEASVMKASGLKVATDSSMMARVRRAAFLPKLSAELGVGRDNFTTEKSSGRAPSSLIAKEGGDFGIAIKATFDLDKLIFSSHELDVLKLSLARLNKREEVIKELHGIYFRYVDLWHSLSSPMGLTKAHERQQEMDRLAAHLDSMSGGAFSEFQNIDIKPGA